MATQLAHPRSEAGDAELARRAAAGDGRAFAELYDRHERRVYGFCLRMLASPHDAAEATQETFVRVLARLPALAGQELNFVAYVLAAARNACYDAMQARRRTEPLAEDGDGPGGGGEGVPRDEDLSRDPERSALLASGREQVQAANAQLPPRQREVLALREVEQLSYDEIGALMALNRNAVAQLVSRARIGLRALLQGGALASIAASGPDCERALPLLASLQDDEVGAGEDLEWVREHLSACETCRLSQASMQEAGASYRLLAPVVPLVWLRHATIARAAEYVGADWSAVAGPGPGTAGGRVDGRGEPGSDGSAAGAGNAVAAGFRVSRRSALVAAGVMLLVCLLLVALVGATRDGRVLEPAAARVTGATPTGHRLRRSSRERVPSARHRAAIGDTGTGALTPTVAGGAASSTATPRGNRPPAASHRRARRSPPARRAKPPVVPTPQPTPTTTTTQTTPPPVTTPPPTTTTTPPPPPPTEPPEKAPPGPAPPGFVP
jgi:RNA polymerase sigma factor (sigma-70 family)